MQTNSSSDYMNYVKQMLDSFGLRPFTDVEIKRVLAPEFYEAVLNSIRSKVEGVDEDSKIDIIKTDIPQIKSKQFEKVPVGEQIIACNLGGTIWKSSVISKTKSGVLEVQKEKKYVMPRKERRCTFRQFILRILKIVDGVWDKSMNQDITVLLSLAFPVQNKLIDDGIDAYFLRRKLPKSWNIIDFGEYKYPSYIGNLLRKNLLDKSFSFNFKNVYIINDTSCVVSFLPSDNEHKDIEKLPVGFVFSNGSNAAIRDLNLEVSKFIRPERFGLAELIHQKMMDLDLIHTKKKFIEHLTGGDYIRYRIAAAISLLSDNEVMSKSIVEWIIDQPDEHFFSYFTDDKIGFKKFIKLDLNNFLDGFEVHYIYKVIKECSYRATIQAGQSIGATIACVTKAAGYKNGTKLIPIDGKVFWESEKIMEKAREVTDMLIEDNHMFFVKAPTLIGGSQLAMVLDNI
ncbi:hypothetical protein GF362_00960 [Candidatus Dojkabacteria bacterium]|nr:hypothetical protein [Candidatus Dojkabacteria bacterium]